MKKILSWVLSALVVSATVAFATVAPNNIPVFEFASDGQHIVDSTVNVFDLWFNKYAAISIDTTLTTAHCGETIDATGSITLTVGSGGAYAARCQIAIHNANANTAIKVVDGGTFRLYPGQTEWVYNRSGTMTYTGPRPYRIQGASLFVDSIAGNDANDGLTSATALKLINTAITRLCSDIDAQGNNSHIQLADASGTDYRENVGVFGQCGNRADGISIIGHAGNVGLTRIIGPVAGGVTTQARDMGILFLTDLTVGCAVGTADGIAVAGSQLGVLDLTRVTIVGCDNGTAIDDEETGAMNLVDTTLSSNMSIGFMVRDAAAKLVVSGTTTCNGALAVTGSALFVVTAQGFANTSGTTWSGCGAMTGKKFAVDYGGGLVTGGVTIPGNIAGTTDAATFGWKQ